MDLPSRLPQLLDGATGTNLFLAGMPYDVCIEKWILEHPETLKTIQKGFIDAGSDAIYAPTFSANRTRLARFGLENEVEGINKRLVALSKSVAKDRLVGGNLSPTGLVCQPFGETSLTELMDIFYEQACALKEAGVDFFAIETMTSLREARAAVLACKKLNLPIFVTFTVDEKGFTPSGATIVNCLVILQELGISAFGINCSNGPWEMADLIEELSAFAKVPLIAKPSAGLPNPVLQNVYNLSPQKMAELFVPILDAGATIIGGCCGTTAEHIKCLRELVDNFDFKSPHLKKDRHDLVLANSIQVFLIDNDNLEFTRPISCSVDMADELLEAENESTDVILIEVHTPEDARLFSLNAHIPRLPVAFYSEDELALKTALLLYNGRAIVDSTSLIERDMLEKIASKYGAVVY
ncbi:MAG: hypothetical protein K0R90_358 [Oscillospiraceae bacterium]|jgi:5-methyltetrahydrofolate--homocysteine methyltransferase|nr:hypothetical protein [Oscillospiraceae bacterium]